ncbi:MAG: ABC transporter ATP-binding protein, partial [Elusimicrobia bacterium]|nr:ABC transporter ATP-binding protein [Elusimicrobiota bacterium]
MSQLEDDEVSRSLDQALLRRFLGYVRPHWAPTAATLAVTLSHIAAGLAAPLVLRAALDGPIAAKDPHGLLRWAGLFFVLVFLDGLFESGSNYLSNLAGQRIIYDLRAQVFAHLQRMPVSFYDRNPVGRLLTRVTGDVENLAELFTSGLVGMLASLLLVVGSAAAMLWLDERLAVYTMLVLPLLVAASAVFRRHARDKYSEARKAIAAVAAYFNESLGGIKTIQSFARESLVTDRFKERAGRHLEAAIGTAYVYSFFWPTIQLTTALTSALVLCVGGMDILHGRISFGTFMAFWYLVRQFFEPIQELAEKYNILQAAMASAERLFKLLDTAPAVAAPRRPAAPPRRGAVEFERVSHSYDGVTPVLDDVSFKVEPGERVAIVGYTGAGKTTLMSLLLRLYDATKGRVLVDGEDVRAYDPKELRRRFGMVFQDVFLFSGTVRENLALGGGAPAEALERAARLSRAETVIERLPQGWDTPVGERGAQLSVGERQLLSFARALVADPAILVLDEATSSVDAETEGLIQEALESMLEGRTALIVAHRLATVRGADRILVMHHGKLREQGTHEELLAQG